MARRDDLTLRLAERLGLGIEAAGAAVLLYLLKRFKLRYRGLHGTVKIPLLGKVYRPIAAAAELAPRFGLRTLDILHVAYVNLFREEGEPLRRILGEGLQLIQ